MRRPWLVAEPSPGTPILNGSRAAPVSDESVSWLQSAARRRGRFVRSLWAAAGPAAVAGAILLLTWSVIGSKVSIYLPPDGAHYIADAHALLGDGVRPLRHPPLFPALVAAMRPTMGDVGGFHLAILASLALLTFALYILLRRWAGRGASLIGASAGVLMPTTAELLGWGGGATLLAAAGLVLSLAALETWIDGRRSGGILLGAGLGLTALTHPFVFGVAMLAIGARWLSVVFERRRFSMGWDPLGLKGMASAAGPLVSAVVLAAPYYLSVEGGGGFSFRVPRPAGLADLLRWAFGADPLPWFLLVLALLAITTYGRRELVVSATCLCGLVVLMATSVTADMSYITRVAYLISVVVAGGVAVAAERLATFLGPRIQPLARRRALLAGVGVLVVAALGLSSYAPRLERAGIFYRFLEPDDVGALRRLADSDGVVATSWHGPEYGTGVSTSWFVEGLARRAAFGPTAPWLSTVPEQRAAGQDMQRLFAGTEGIENGAVQVASGPSGARADPAVQILSDGFYFPLLFGNSFVNGYPITFAGDSSRDVVGDEIHWTFRDPRGWPAIHQVARLDGKDVMLEYELAPGADPGSWSLWFWPAYGVHWKDVRAGAGEVRGTRGLPEEDIEFRISVSDGDVVYHPVEERFQVEAIEVRVDDARAVTIAIEVKSRARAGHARAFDEEAILEAYGIADVVVWKDTGWRDRFDRSDCYALADESSGLLIYRVLSCSGGLG